MKKRFLLLMLLAPFMLYGCVTGPGNVMTGMLTGTTNVSYKDAPVVLTYSGEEVIRDQAKVATLVFQGTYGAAINGVSIKEREGGFNSGLRVSKAGNKQVYIVDLLPGTYDLTVTYDSFEGAEHTPTDPEDGAKIGNAKVGVSLSGPSIFSWERESRTTHTLKGGEVYAVGLKLLSITGEMDLYTLTAEENNAVIETRNKAEF